MVAIRRSTAMAATCRRRGIRPNRIKASLSVFQRCEVKVLGFDVKACPRPQRMALRWDYDPFALVGANGKACGEAPGVSVSGTPPLFFGGVPPLDIENRSHFWGIKKAPRVGCLVCGGLVVQCRAWDMCLCGFRCVAGFLHVAERSYRGWN